MRKWDAGKAGPRIFNMTFQGSSNHCWFVGFFLKKSLSNLPNTFYNSKQLELNLLFRELQTKTDSHYTLQ